jgi:hypothetical protein
MPSAICPIMQHKLVQPLTYLLVPLDTILGNPAFPRGACDIQSNEEYIHINTWYVQSTPLKHRIPYYP